MFGYYDSVASSPLSGAGEIFQPLGGTMRTFSAVVVFVALALVSACSSKGGGGNNPIAPTGPTMVEVPAGHFTFTRDPNSPFYDDVGGPGCFQFHWTDAAGENSINLNDNFDRDGIISWDPATKKATLTSMVRLPTNHTPIKVSVCDIGGIVGAIIYLDESQLTDVQPGAAGIPGDTRSYNSHANFQIPGIQ